MQIIKFTYRLWPGWMRSITARVPDPRIEAKRSYTMEQAIFSGLMIFILRYRSLHSFCLENKNNPFTLKNFGKGITIKDIPSDDGLRYCLQTVSTKSLNDLLKDFHQTLERKKILNDQKLFDRHELICLDGTGQISSQKIQCEKCLVKTLHNGDTVYYHGQLLASLTNIKGAYALPLQFEPIEKNDIDTQYSKNDCELNAGKRLLQKLRIQFPKRNFCILADNLFGVDPIVSLILEKQWHFLITAKPDRNKELFWMYEYMKERKQYFEFTDFEGVTRQYRWLNKLPLKQYNKNDPHPINVNLLEYAEINSEGQVKYESSWMTDFEISKDNVKKLVLAARARFVIENRNFNEQKNLGFHTEHNFGHFGNLPNVFFGLAQIAQVITELFRFWCPAKTEIDKVGSKRRYFEKLAVVISVMVIEDSGLPILYLKFDFNTS